MSFCLRRRQDVEMDMPLLCCKCLVRRTCMNRTTPSSEMDCWVGGLGQIEDLSPIEHHFYWQGYLRGNEGEETDSFLQIGRFHACRTRILSQWMVSRRVLRPGLKAVVS